MKEAEEALHEAAGLIRAQEKKIALMKEAGLNTTKAQALLLAYRNAIELATQRYNTLRALAHNKQPVESGGK